jgi:hypothetical protein
MSLSAKCLGGMLTSLCGKQAIRMCPESTLVEGEVTVQGCSNAMGLDHWFDVALWGVELV